MTKETSASCTIPFHLAFTTHAQVRKQQRGISDEMIRHALSWGRIFAQGCGRIAYFLGRQECRHAAREGLSLWASEGVAVIESSDGYIVTVIRCSSPSKIKKMHLLRSEQNGGSL